MANKVAIIKCDNYEEEKVYLAVKRVSELAGGFASFLKSGMKVLVKPNLLTAFTPEAAVTTHPMVLKAVIRLVKEQGAIPFIGDCHGGILIGTEFLLTETGMRKVEAETGAEIISLEKLGSDNYDGIVLTRALKQFDAIINVCKFKTHMLTFLTGAVKNLFGLVPGMNKASMHRVYPDYRDFSAMLYRLSEIVKPAFSITDGIVGMEGEGPSGGSPKQIGVLIASKDTVANDFAIGKIAGIDPLTLPIIQCAVSKGFKPENLEFVGDELSTLILKDFKMPLSYVVDGKKGKDGLLRKILNPLMPLVWNLATVKPLINNKKCQKCNECVKACPVKAISYAGGFPKVTKKKCIECYCCHELCPHRAIELNKSFFVKLWLSRQRPKK